MSAPVKTPWPWSRADDSNAALRIGKPFTVIEQKPELRRALHESPTTVTVAEEKRRDMCVEDAERKDKEGMKRRSRSGETRSLRSAGAS